jgi:hypothetical protein
VRVKVHIVRRSDHTCGISLLELDWGFSWANQMLTDARIELIAQFR